MRWILKITGYALLAAVFALCLRTVPPQIESDLLSTTQAALKQQQLDWVLVSIDGRDITLSGSPPDRNTASKAVTLVRKTAGVRKVSAAWAAPSAGSGSNSNALPGATTMIDIAAIHASDADTPAHDSEVTAYEDLITLPLQPATNYEISQ